MSHCTECHDATARNRLYKCFLLKAAVFGEYSIEGGAQMYAIIKTGGKQYSVEEGKIITVEKLSVSEGEEVAFDEVLLISGETVKIGQPVVEGAKVTAKVLAQGKEKKIRIFKYKAKSNYRRRQGHRQPFTRVQIEKIEG